ncbi:MAG: 16S rRNA (cytosine(1402)-N(4))-methyltransferase RsmH [Candidatus Paceibacterota bacterium]
MHIPVLLKEVLECLNPGKNENFIDCTLNGGGHTQAILKMNGPNGKVLGIEWDKEIHANIQKQKLERLIAINDSYANLKNIVEENNFNNVSGILFDLGMSSYQIDEAERGFSFTKNQPLIMAYGETDKNAKEIINKYPQDKLEKIISEYGEEKFAKKIAKKIAEARKIKPIETTFDLVEIIKQATPAHYHHQKLHFATRTFQAIRIETNQELENIKAALPQALQILDSNGRLAIISFHSLEDRIVKNFFKEQEQSGKIKLATKKPITASREESENNPRARSAKLRAIIKI